MEELVYEKDGKYFLKPETEISKEQYDDINAASAEQPVSGDLSEASILRLHQESDPASPLYKGSEPTDGGTSILADGESESHSGFYEPTADNIDPVADAIPAPAGTTSFSTEEVSKPYEPVPTEPVVEPTPETETKSETEDAGNA